MMEKGAKAPSVTCTTCPYCGVGCGVQVTQRGSSVEITGDEKHPANFGKLCSKGYALGETLGYDNRLLGPTINNVEVSWEEALTRVSDEFKSVLNDYGPEAVAFYVSGQLLTEDYYVVNKLVKGYLGTANIDTNSRLCMASSVAGHKRAFGSDTVPGCYEDIELADVLVLVGSNLAWCHPVLFRRIESAREANPNLKVVVIDPRLTATAEMADLHLPIAPGGENDIALFLGLLAEVANKDQIDQQWVALHTTAVDDALKEALPWTIERVAQRTGLNKKAVKDFYRLFLSTDKVVTLFSQGVNQSHCGTDTVNSIINVHLARGQIGKPGSGPFSVTGQPNAMGGREVGGLANMLAAHMNIENDYHRDVVKRFWNSPTVASKPGLKAVDLFDAVEVGQIKVLWIMATNPADSMPAANEVSRAIANCPFVVVSDVSKQSDTGNLATVRLPAQAWSEKDGTVTNSERRISRQRAFRTAPMEAKPDWWAVCEVAKRLGFESGFQYQNASEIFAEHAALSGFENDGTRDFDISAFSNITLEEFDALTPFQWPRTKASKASADKNSVRLFSDGRFFTTDRKARFVAVSISDIGAVTSPLLKIYSPSSHKAISVLVNTGRTRDQWHTMTRTGYVAKLCSHLSEPYVQINPKDANELELTEASLVDITSDLGVITVRALFSDAVLSGTAFVPMHWSNVFSSNARVNTLIQPRTDPVSGQPALKHQRVMITPTEVACYGVMLSRHKPANLGFLNYWSSVPVDGGWKTEIASVKQPQSLMDTIIARSQISLSTAEKLTCSDNAVASFKTCWFEGNDLAQAVYLAPEPVWAPRQLISALLVDKFHSISDRLAALSAAGRQDKINHGAIVCSCMGVGCKTIEHAIAQGADSIKSVGDLCAAGTVCGSCQPEIKTLLKRFKDAEAISHKEMAVDEPESTVA